MHALIRSAGISLWLLLGALWLANLPFRPLFDPDEGRYAEIPREMVASGDWVTPTLNGMPYFEKPPLQYWATSVFYSVFGVHEWTARLWAASLAFLCIPLVFAFARRLGYPAETALIAAALLAVNPYFALIGQLDLLDQGFTFFLSAAAFSFVIAQRESLQPRRSRSWMLVTWASLALAILSKGIVTLVLAGATLCAYMAITRDASILRRLNPVPGVALLLLIAVPWFWMVQGRNPDFLQFFFVHEHLQRYFTDVHERVQPFWFFIPIVLLSLLPLIGNWKTWKLANIEGTRAPGEFRAELFLLLWCAVTVVLFSFSHSKLPPYVMPVMPALAVVLARVTQENSRALPRAKWIVIAGLLAASAGIVIAGWRLSRAISVPALAWPGVLAVACVAYLLSDRRAQASLSSSWVKLAAVSIVGFQLLGLAFAVSFPSKSAEQLTAGFAGALSDGTAVYTVSQYRHSLAFYLRRPLVVYDYVGELEFGMRHAHGPFEPRTRAQFLEQWRRETHAIAFIDPSVYAELSAAGLPGRIVARDERSIVIARS